MTKLINRSYVHDHLKPILSVSDLHEFTNKLVETVRDLATDSRYEGRLRSFLEALSEDVSSVLNEDEVSAIKAYSAAKALHLPGGVLSGQPFGLSTMYAKLSLHTAALCMDASGIKVSDTLLTEARRNFVLNCIRGRENWKKTCSEAAAIKQDYGISGLDDYFSELLGSAHNHLRPLDAKEFPETGCKEFLESRGMSPRGVLAKFSFGLETSTQAITTFRRLIRVVESLSDDLGGCGDLSSDELTEIREKLMAGILHIRASKSGEKWRPEDDRIMLRLVQHVHPELPLKSIMQLARLVQFDQTNLANVDLTQIHGLRNVKSAVMRYVDPSEATIVIENAGLSDLFSPAELRRFRGHKLETDLGM